MEVLRNAVIELLKTAPGHIKGHWSELDEVVKALAQSEQEPVAYLDAVDNKTVYVAPVRKRWLDPHQDKEWKQFHCDHQYDTPLYTAPPSKRLTDEDTKILEAVRRELSRGN